MSLRRAEDISRQIPLSGEFLPTPIGRVIYGKGAIASLGSELDRLGKRRVVVIISKSLVRCGAMNGLREVLGSRFVGSFADTEAHVPRTSAIRAATLCRDLKADVMVTLGGSTCIDTARAAGILVGNSPGGSVASELATFDRYRIRFTYPDNKVIPDLESPPLRFIAIQTTLSGGEFTFGLGMKNDVTGAKEIYFDPRLAPLAVYLDSDMTQWTPTELWYASGVKAIDHIVESVYSKRHFPLNDALGLQALTIMTHCLPRSIAEPELRLRCQIGAWLAMYGVYPSVGPGVGHAIDHQLGSKAGVPHGLAAAIMLPHAMEYNRDAALDRFILMADSVGLEYDRTASGAAADALTAFIRNFIRSLGLPSRLREVGVDQKSLPDIANATWDDMVISGNPRTVNGTQDILGILERAW